jgi:hypothetical protein
MERETARPAVHKREAAADFAIRRDGVGHHSLEFWTMRILDLLIYGGAVVLTVGIIVLGLLWWIGVLRCCEIN